MPYAGETAPVLGAVGTARSQLIADVLATYEVVGDDSNFATELRAACVPLTDLDLPVEPDSVGLCLSLDGSRQQDVLARPEGGRPVSVGFVRVGGCFLDLDALREIESETLVDPIALARTRRGVAFDYVLPGAGVVARDTSAGESWRKALDSFFAAATVTDGALADPLGIGITLADALLLLHGRPGAPASRAPIRRCPACGESSRDGLTYVERDGGTCPACKAHLYLTDSLNLDAAIASENSRENALTVTMNAAERFALIAFLELLRQRSLDELSTTIVVADGPLAAFGPLAPLTRPIRRYIDELGAEVLNATGRPLLLVGVEKSGEFAAHGATIKDFIEPGHVMRMTNDYISTHITGRSWADKPYGAEHLYGRRFFYRRHDGHLLTVTVPAAIGVVPWSLDPESEDWTSYPTLRPVLTLLESLRSNRHEGAVLPLVFAHEVTALPMGTGQSVLTLVGQQGLGLAQNTRLRADQPKRVWAS